MRYRLRTLLLLLALGPPIIAGIWFDWSFALVAGLYVAAIVLLLPAASYLWRNSV
jgi:hypothetical protein